MAHNKLYRSFIILQEDEKLHSTSGDKALSGYAKIEAKSDKCKISFYAQNLKEDDKYFIVLICYKKNMKQVVDLGSLTINKGGKSEVTKEYYVNNIAGLELCYDKISGAAVAKKTDGKYNYVMYGFMNGEHVKEDWKKCKVIHSNEYEGVIESKVINKEECKEENLKLNKVEKEECSEEKEHKHKEKEDKKEYKSKEICEEKKEKKELKDKEHCEEKKEKKELKDKEHCEEKKEKKELKDKECCEEKKEKKEIKEKECCDKKEDKKELKEKEHCEEKKEHKHKNSWEEIKEKKIDKDSYTEKEFKKEFKKLKHLELNDDHDCENNYSFRNNTLIADFDEYETRIEREKSIDPYEFDLRGGLGEYFKEITNGFEEIKNKYKDIRYCKWYKVNIKSIEDMCNSSDQNKYTLVYYPMINYFPYIRRYGHFIFGYKCNNKGDVKYIVYGVPGRKEKEEQPFMGRTGFVTWMKTDDKGMGMWLMFYDYKNSIVVVPVKE